MQTDRQKLEQLAEKLVEDHAIDWREASSAEDAESTRSAIKSLQAVQKLRVFALDEATQMPDLTRELPASSLPLPDSTVPLPSGTRWGHLEIREVIGRGVQGVVYRAWDPTLETEVALKLDCDRRIARDEARRLARIKHPHVVRVYGAAEHDGQFGLWMEYVKGRTLAERIAAEGPMSESEATDLGIKLASALAEIHAVNVVHQDVKARNVMREERGRYVLMDLGCGADLDKGQTEVGGTPYYMAPEMLDGARPDKSADIYSLGVLLYHVVTGRFPYEGLNLREVRERQRVGSPARLQDLRPELSSHFCAVVERAIALDPRQRYASASALRADLEPLPGTNGIREPGFFRRLWRRLVVRYVSLPRPARVVVWTSLVIASLFASYAVIESVTEPGRLDLALELLRIGPGTTEILQSGSSIRAEDRLRLQLESVEECHVYVFGADEEGGLVQLFPLSYSEQRNPLSAEEIHELPGRRNDGVLSWKMSSTPGRDRLLVIASRERFVELETYAERLRELPGPETPQQRQLGSLRGWHYAEEIPDSLARVQEAETEYRQLKRLAGELEDAFVREYQLINAGN